MSAPERIWAASVTENYGEWQTTTDGLPRPTEYVRADLAMARCSSCDGAGDVHRADGEWLGECNCGSEFRHAYDVEASPSKAFRVIQGQADRIAALEAQLAEVDTHRHKIIAENERLLHAFIEKNRILSSLEASPAPVSEEVDEAEKWCRIARKAIDALDVISCWDACDDELEEAAGQMADFAEKAAAEVRATYRAAFAAKGAAPEPAPVSEEMVVAIATLFGNYIPGHGWTGFGPTPEQIEAALAAKGGQ